MWQKLKNGAAYVGQKLKDGAVYVFGGGAIVAAGQSQALAEGSTAFDDVNDIVTAADGVITAVLAIVLATVVFFIGIRLVKWVTRR